MPPQASTLEANPDYRKTGSQKYGIPGISQSRWSSYSFGIHHEGISDFLPAFSSSLAQCGAF